MAICVPPLFALAVYVIGGTIESYGKYYRAQHPAEAFGCDRTYVNAKGEDTGECP